jgi:hypothetical protein
MFERMSNLIILLFLSPEVVLCTKNGGKRLMTTFDFEANLNTEQEAMKQRKPKIQLSYTLAQFSLRNCLHLFRKLPRNAEEHHYYGTQMRFHHLHIIRK